MNIDKPQIMNRGIKAFVEDGYYFNETDIRIISFLFYKTMSVTELTKKLEIAHVNVWKRLKSLTAEGLIDSPKVSRGHTKTLSLTNRGKKIYTYWIQQFETRAQLNI